MRLPERWEGREEGGRGSPVGVWSFGRVEYLGSMGEEEDDMQRAVWEERAVRVVVGIVCERNAIAIGRRGVMPKNVYLGY